MFGLTFILRILDVQHKTSKVRDNFLLQHETREMSVVATVVIQFNPCWHATYLHPDFIAFCQVQRRLEGQRTPLIIDGVCLFYQSRPDSIPIQKKTNS